MNTKVLLLCLVWFTLVTRLAAQTKFSGIAQCHEPDQQHSINAGDSADHSFVLSQEKCTWIKPMEIAGIQSKEDLLTDAYEIIGSGADGRGYDIETFANGDKLYCSSLWQIADIKEGLPQSGQWTCTFIGGTGKFDKIKGKVSCKWNVSNTTWECEGEYELHR